MVSDDTSVSKIMILDKVANGIVAESPKKLLNGSWDEVFPSPKLTFRFLLQKQVFI